VNEKEISEYLKIIDELEKKGFGDYDDLEKIRKRLIKDKDLEEGYVSYLTRSYSKVKGMPDTKELQKRIEESKKSGGPLVTTTEAIQGKTIDEYLGIVSGHAVMGMGFFKDIVGGFRDIIGGRSSSLEAHFVEARDFALNGMIDEAIKLGANAIVAVRFNDISMEGKDRQMALVAVHGTAVRIRD